MEVPNAIISEADHRSIFAPLAPRIKHCASVYADDIVILLSPCAQDFNTIHRILDLFAGASSLATVDKCVLTPICCSNEQYKVQDFPTKYLEVPLSLSRIARTEEQRLVDTVAARIRTWKAGLRCQTGNPHPDDVVRDTCTRGHVLLPLSLGYKGDRQKTPRIPLGRHRVSLWRTM